MKVLKNKLRLPGDPPRPHGDCPSHPAEDAELPPLHEMLRALVYLSAVVVLAYAFFSARV